MSRLADGRYRCPCCEGVFEREDMPQTGSYCWPCRRARSREDYTRQAADAGRLVSPRRHNIPIPDGFVRATLGKADVEIAAMYDVSPATARRWRISLGLTPARVSMPLDFATQAAGLTYTQVAERWRIAVSTAYRWLRVSAGGPRKRGRVVLPVPADWAEVCASRSRAAAEFHYQVCEKTIRRWSIESGIAPLAMRRGRPATVKPATAKPAKSKPAATDARRVALTFRRDPRPVPAPVVPQIAGCPDCTPTRLCRACQAAQVQADIDAWLAAGNKPAEVPVGVSGRAAA